MLRPTCPVDYRMCNQTVTVYRIKDGKYIRRERFFGSAKRTFYVGEDVTEEDIKAKYEDGILTLDIPKKEAQPVVEQKRFINID